MLEVDNLQAYYGRAHILQDLSFAVTAGEVHFGSAATAA